MKKLLLCLLALLLIFSCAACADKTAEPDIKPNLPVVIEEPEEDEDLGEPELTAVNIYHLGIQTPLDISSAQTIALAGQLITLLDNAAATDSMDTAPEDSPNPIQVEAGQTALELIYSHRKKLPIQEAGSALKAQKLLYSIPVSGSDGGLLYLGMDLYEEAPAGKVFDQALQDAIYNTAADQVEVVEFAAGGAQVIINGLEYAYETGEDSVEAQLPDVLLHRMLYRCIAFYLNAYTGNVNGLKMMSTIALTEAVAAVKDGKYTTNEFGEEAVAKLNQFITADFFLPQTIIAPVEQDGLFLVFLQLSENLSVEFAFVVQEDIPLISSLRIIKSEIEETEVI